MHTDHISVEPSLVLEKNVTTAEPFEREWRRDVTIEEFYRYLGFNRIQRSNQVSIGDDIALMLSIPGML